MKKLWFDDKYVYLLIDDSSVRRLLINSSARLAQAEQKERENYRLMDDGINWPDIDENIPFEAFSEKVEETLQLGVIPEYISMAYLAKRFFGKSRFWLHNKLKGNIVNGKPIALNKAELATFKKALETIASEISAVADGLPH